MLKPGPLIALTLIIFEVCLQDPSTAIVIPVKNLTGGRQSVSKPVMNESSLNSSSQRNLHVSWIEYLGICRRIRSYKRVSAQTATGCKNHCATDQQCAMVKYHQVKKRCWLSKSTKMRVTKVCPADYDFYVKDVDECARSKDICGNKSKCVNLPGSYKCVCLDGYKMGANVCQDVNECVQSKYLCTKYAKCVNTIGSYKCVCRKGFHRDRNICNDVDECTKGNHMCEQKCTNSVGSYRCSCKRGYVAHGRSCKDINECKSHNTCQKNATCINSQGSYRCECKTGYRLEERKCLDVNECSKGKTLCGHHFKCTNTIGSYKCICKDGFRVVGKHCRDINECATLEDVCGENSICINKIGSFKCSCKTGFQWDGEVCKDINECAKSNKTCGEYGECVNKLGSYKCLCKNGFRLDGNLCKDINECSQLTFCGNNSSCVNTPGSYSCVCKGGYIKIGSKCEAVQTQFPVEFNTTTVSRVATIGVREKRMALATEENKTSTAKELTTPSTQQTNMSSKKHPIKIPIERLIISSTKQPTSSSGPSTMRTPELPSMQHNKQNTISSEQITITATGNATMTSTEQPTMTSTEQPTMTPTELPTMTSTERPMPNMEQPTIPNVEHTTGFTIQKGKGECGGKKKCHRNAVCKSTSGRKVCECVYGFKGDGWDCADIDECSFYKHLCSMNARCLNSVGSYSCTCKRGYFGDGRKCHRRKSGSNDKKLTTYNLKELIRQWKAEHSGQLPTFMVNLRIIVAAFLLVQAFHKLL